MTAADPKPRWYRLTPDRVLAALFLAECLLWLSNRLDWPPWHKGYAVLSVVVTAGLFVFLMLIWFAVSLHFRRRFQFGILSGLILAVVIALPYTWLTVEMKKAAEQQKIVNGLEFNCDWQIDANGREVPNAQPPEPELLRAVLGVEFFDVVVFAKPTDDAQLERVKKLPGLRYVYARLITSKITDAGLQHLDGWTGPQALWLDSTEITDAGVQHLAGLNRLELLSLFGTKITDAGLQFLEGLTRLEVLKLNATEVTDAGLRHLKPLSQLEDLDLRNTAITDAGLRHLEGLTQLESLWLFHTRVTNEGVKRLQNSLPHCKIIMTAFEQP